MNELLELLKGINSKVDFENEKQLVTGKVLDSIDITSMIAEIEDHFDIEITMEYMVNENFDSVDAMWEMIQELQD
ncbi:MAG: phosphopantetheine-binding protein [Faecalibacterium sp.]|nr:phosphopantetheine-binding protein [Ruminococcus sp.]MCM1392934.1 phosphopantetheine-binding protein [Ruminococcus sp.]MCM1485376.1 phosphopantetheine-binding protein [Faecalibacterium sp.]